MKHIKIIIFSALTVALSGCLGSFLEPKEDPTVFYVMRSQQDVEKVEFASPLEINMLNVIVPAYMSRNQIVILEKSTIEISEFNRWAELPTEGIERVLQDNLAAASSKLSVYVYPAMSFDKSAVGLRVFISDFIGEFGGDIVLKGKWQLSSNPEAGQSGGSFEIKVPCGSTYDSYVSAMNKALYELSQQIAKSMAKEFEILAKKTESK